MPVDANPESLSQFVEQAYNRTWTRRDEVLEAHEKLHAEMKPSDRNTIVLGFALAKICDDLGEVDRAFSLLRDANRYHRAYKTDTLADARTTVSRVREIFTSQSVSPLPGADGFTPLLVVGLPRSGTTLVEQILATHSQVHGGGELRLIGEWCNGYLRLFSQYGLQARLDDHLPKLRQHYLQGLQQLTPAGFVSDKMPLNFLWLGFIVNAIPEVRIVHTRRDPMAVCWSLFKSPFAGSSNGYACDLDGIGQFYLLYDELMSFWNERYGDVIHALDYERLTTDQETETRRLLHYCGLPWEAACLEFHTNPREVNTVSRLQVTRPMYRGSSLAWKRYAHHLTALQKVLEPVLART